MAETRFTSLHCLFLFLSLAFLTAGLFVKPSAVPIPDTMVRAMGEAETTEEDGDCNSGFQPCSGGDDGNICYYCTETTKNHKLVGTGPGAGVDDNGSCGSLYGGKCKDGKCENGMSIGTCLPVNVPITQ